MSLSFVVPAFLAGLLALAVPVLIHLTRRPTRDSAPFPSLMFLRRIPHRSTQKRQIHRWPLLLLRCAAIALLVLAFARPFLERDGAPLLAGGGGDREVVILLDRSFSMGYGERWSEAVSAALEVVDGLSIGDRATLVLFDAGAEASTEATSDRGVLRAAIRRAEPGTRTTRYAPGMRYAARLLSTSPLPRRELVVISDFQRNAWDTDAAEIGSIRLPGGTAVTPIVIGADDALENVTVAQVEIQRSVAEGRERVSPTARVARRGGDDPREVPVTLELDGRAVETRTLTLGANESGTVQFAAVTLPATGTLRATVRTPADDLTIDDAFNFVLSADQGVGVLIVEGPNVTSAASFYLERALAIGTNPGFRTTVRRAGDLRAADLASHSVVIMNQAPVPGGEVGERLREHVDNGGGLVLILGDNAPGDWSGVLPGGVPPAVDRLASGGTALGYVDLGHPIFEPFAGPRSGDLSAGRVYRYRPLQSGAMPRVLARFGDGGTALAERPVGNGRVLIWTSTLDASWNDLALQPVFLPFLHQLVKYSAGYAPGQGWLTVGEAFDPLAALPPGERYDLALAPSGERIALGDGAPLELGEVGFYELRDSGDDGRRFSLAVNVDPAGAELDTFDPADLAAALSIGGDPADGTLAFQELSLAERERQQSGWWYLIVLAFILLAVETFFSNRLRETARTIQARPDPKGDRGEDRRTSGMAA
jgi:hypothetical protein